MGRQIETGIGCSKKKWIGSNTAKGTADVKATIEGMAVDIEIKIGRDRPSPDQLKMQQRVRKARGIYEFVGDMQTFYELYDRIVSTYGGQSKLFIQL